MRGRFLIVGALLGGLTSLPAMALSYLAWQAAKLPFFPFDAFDWLARTLPGDIITLGIDTIVNLVNSVNAILSIGTTSTAAKSVEQAMALGGGVVVGVLLGLGAAATIRRAPEHRWASGIGVGLVGLLIIGLIEMNLGLLDSPLPSLIWLGVLLTGWGVALVQLLAFVQAAQRADEVDTGRREALIQIAGASIVLTLVGWGLGRWLSGGSEETGAGQPLANLPSAPSQLPSSTASPTPLAMQVPEASSDVTNETTPVPSATATTTARERVPAAPGTRMELTPNDRFYRIDINTRPVRVDGDSWELQVEGLFDNPRSVTISDLMAYPAVTEPITLSCISNRIGGDLIGTSNWTGLRLRDLLKDLGLRSEAQELYIEGADGFYESVAMEDMMDPRTLLVYGMNGETLPVEHGYPLRIYIPNRYGMKQPKWITRIEAIDKNGPGYWVDRGWSAEARPKIVSVIDTVAIEAEQNGNIPIGGIAWAGDRGIQKVELQVDDGDWVETTLRTPPLSSLTWVQWRYDWPKVSGPHTFRVRTVDGTGALQTEARSGAHPDGATGYHEKTVAI
jgi:DMSO/TMAO reductase YedYZ molybdopterin-dependent catalytic subunit